MNLQVLQNLWTKSCSLKCKYVRCVFALSIKQLSRWKPGLTVSDCNPSDSQENANRMLQGCSDKLDNTDGMNEIGRAVHPDDLIPMIPTSRRIQGHNEAKEDMVDTTKDTTLEGEE